MSYTAHRLIGIREALAQCCADSQASESFDSRLRALAAYLIGRFA
jgi:hypothetical protein